jgi:DNA-directed RNA polymerase subunit N (RpoN/RPB10)
VGNSKARRQVLEREIFQNRKERVAEEVGVRRACCEGGRRQIVPKDSRNV